MSSLFSSPQKLIVFQTAKFLRTKAKVLVIGAGALDVKYFRTLHCVSSVTPSILLRLKFTQRASMIST